MKNFKTNIIFLVIICLVVLYVSLKDDFGTIVAQIYEINFWWFLLACGLMFLYFVFRAFEMHDLVKLVDKGYSYRKALGIVIIGQFFANITPSSLGTQPAQIYFLNKDKVKASDGTRIVIQYNFTYQLAMLIITVITIILASIYNIFDSISAGLLLKELVIISLIIHLVVLLILLIVNYSKDTNSYLVKKTIRFLSFIKVVRNKQKTLDEWAFHLHDFHDGSKSILSHKRKLLKGVIYSGFAIVCLYMTPLVLLYSMGDFASLQLMGTTVASSYTTIISSVIPSPGGTGAFEYFFTQFFGVFISGATLVSLMLLWRMVTYYFVLLVGTIILIFNQERIV